jgi:hypothetical protein
MAMRSLADEPPIAVNALRNMRAKIAGKIAMDLLRKSGEFPMSYEELDDTAATVYEGI